MKARSAWLAALLAATAQAEERSVSPYIDEIRRDLEAKEPKPQGVQDPYIQSIKKRLQEKDAANGQGESYIDYLKKHELEPKDGEDGSYTGREKQRLGPGGESGGAIQALKEGRSDLKARRSGEIHHAAGLRYGASITRDITASGGTGLRLFNDVYGAGTPIELGFFYEYQPFHSEVFGNIGIVANGGVSYVKGTGAFRFNLSRPGGVNFGNQSRTKFQFFTLPAMAGLSYRFNLLKYVRPFVMGGPSLIGYSEVRNDGGEGNSGTSSGLWISGGVSFLLDWISGTSSWDLYVDRGVKHYYLTVEYARLSTLSGDVSFNVSGIYAGISFEF